MVKTKNQFLVLLTTSILTSLVFYLSISLALSLMKKDQSTCNTGIAPCFAGTENLWIIGLGFVLGVMFMGIVFRIFSIKKWFILTLCSFLTFLILTWLFAYFGITEKELVLLIYPVFFLIYYFLFD